MYNLHYNFIVDQPLSNYEPSPPAFTASSASSEQLYVYGGVVNNFDENIRQLRTVIQIYECTTESWKELPTSGTPPPGIYGCATSYSCYVLYLFGGRDGTSYHASLHQLDTRSMTWKQLSPQHDSGPMRKSECQMIYYNDSLIVIGGCGIPSGELHSGSQFTRRKHHQDGRGYTNEIHKYNHISQGKSQIVFQFICRDLVIHIKIQCILIKYYRYNIFRVICRFNVNYFRNYHGIIIT